MFRLVPVRPSFFPKQMRAKRHKLWMKKVKNLRADMKADDLLNCAFGNEKNFRENWKWKNLMEFLINFWKSWAFFSSDRSKKSNSELIFQNLLNSLEFPLRARTSAHFLPNINFYHSSETNSSAPNSFSQMLAGSINNKKLLFIFVRRNIHWTKVSIQFGSAQKKLFEFKLRKKC